ncbi:kxDL motif-containing protein 1 isoform X1 [Rattus norvegicus]|nr:kxDL motif-containing protein 1 isoform X1 [Rattus norvegicus]|eukprot:XP_006252984.1 PREDICTED: kxDL motif-containing protein 1 isoform X1 [Rattus norvegicus]
MRSPAPACPLAGHAAAATLIGFCTRLSRALDTAFFLASGVKEKEMDTPDSASRVFCGRFLSMVNTDDVNAIILAQKNMLDRFEKTNEMLLNFNNLSSVRLQQMSERFMHHTRTLVDMKRDLDSIFRRIRTLKGKLARQHPEAFSHIPEGSLLEDEDEDPVPPSITTTIATSEQSTGSCDTSPDTASPSFSPGFEDLSHIRPGSPAINGHSQTDDEEETREE